MAKSCPLEQDGEHHQECHVRQNKWSGGLCIVTTKTGRSFPGFSGISGLKMLPKLIVFDLDFTLWDCDGTWCDCLSPLLGWNPEWSWTQQNDPLPYPDVKQLNNAKHLIAKWQHHALNNRVGPFTDRFIGAHLIFCILGNLSLKQSNALLLTQKASRFEFSQMLFYDESRNISEVSSLGVACVHVTQGLNQSLFDASLQRFQQNHFQK